MGGGFLVNGNGGTQAIDRVDVGFIQLSQELAGVGTQGLHIAALTFGEDGIKGEGRFPRAGNPRKNDQAIAG
jgi:hypothetical protein